MDDRIQRNIDVGASDTPVLFCSKYVRAAFSSYGGYYGRSTNTLYPEIVSDSLSNNLVYGTFIRSISANDMIFRQYLSYIQMMGWRRISVFFSDDSLGRSASLVISYHAAEYGVRVINSYSLQEYHHERDLRPQLNTIRDTGSYVNLILANGHYLVHALSDVQ